MRRLDYFRTKRRIRQGVVFGALILLIFILVAIMIVNYQYVKLLG